MIDVKKVGEDKLRQPLASILILGAYGMLGRSLSLSLSELGYQVFDHGRGEQAQVNADLADKAQLHSLLDNIRPDVIINLAALTDVDLCERNPQLAYLTNVRTLENVVSWIQGGNAPPHLIHISTDQVYDGAGPHSETDTLPSNYYGYSKLVAELVASRVPSTTLRTNFFGLSRHHTRRSFSDWLVNALKSGQKIQVFNDVLFSPLLLTVLCDAVEKLIRLRPTGVYNLGANDGMSKAEFAFAVARSLDLDLGLMESVSHKDVSFLRAYRPADMRMNSQKIEQVLGLRLPTLIDQINLMKNQYDSHS